MSGACSLPIWKALDRLNDSELIEMLPYIRDEEGERVNLHPLRRYLRKMREEEREDQVAAK